MFKNILNKCAAFFKSVPSGIVNFFKAVPEKAKRWWRGEVITIKRKTTDLPNRLKLWAKSKIGTIIVFAFVIIFVIVGYFSIQTAKSNAITYSKDYEAPEATADLQADGEYKVIAKNEYLELLFCEEKGAIQIKNLENGSLWKSIADEDVYPSKGVNKQWVAYMRSPICISYNDLKKRDSGVKKVYAGKDCGYLDIEYIDNGVAVTYGFLAPGIYVTVEYTIDGDELVVRVPYEKIREDWKYAVTTIEVMPFLGACDNSNDGYIFYPDGSGAITCFDRVGERTSNVKIAYYYTYSHKTVSLENFEEDTANRYAASLPVYGIKNGDNALFAYVTDGAASTGLAVYPSGYVLNLNHLGFEVYVRNVFNVNMYNMSGEDGAAQTGGVVQRVDTKLIEEDKVIRYAFLSGDKANYSGMADTYREYLLENGLLNYNIDEDSEYSLALKLLMGTKKSGIIFDEYVKMTGFDDVSTILDYLAANGITNTEVVLDSWSKSETDYWSPKYRLGGKTGLKNLGKYILENNNANVYLETTFAECTSDTKGIDLDEDVVYDGLDTEVSETSMKGFSTYLVNPYAMLTRNNSFLKKLSGYDGISVAYSKLARYTYPDYNEYHTYTANETVSEIRNLLSNTESDGRKIALSGANQYVYTYADFLYELREESYGLAITDYSVPFVQMVISGCIPYATEGAGNLSYDLDLQKLKWIEYGSMPYFYLTYESALNLRDTEDDTLFSSTWSDWDTVVIDTYNEFKDNFGSTYGVQMVEHTILSDDLVRVKYANGLTVYVNYDTVDKAADGITIPAKDYVVTGGNN